MTLSVMSASNFVFLICDTIVICKGTDDLYVCCRDLGDKVTVQDRVRIELKVEVSKGGMGCPRNVH